MNKNRYHVFEFFIICKSIEKLLVFVHQPSKITRLGEAVKDALLHFLVRCIQQDKQKFLEISDSWNLLEIIWLSEELQIRK
jgi:hypothetical protein